MEMNDDLSPINLFSPELKIKSKRNEENGVDRISLNCWQPKTPPSAQQSLKLKAKDAESLIIANEKLNKIVYKHEKDLRQAKFLGKELVEQLEESQSQLSNYKNCLKESPTQRRKLETKVNILTKRINEADDKINELLIKYEESNSKYINEKKKHLDTLAAQVESKERIKELDS